MAKDASQAALDNLRTHNPIRTYDPHCYDLAGIFIAPEDDNDLGDLRSQLAAQIQDTIEEFLVANELEGR